MKYNFQLVPEKCNNCKWTFVAVDAPIEMYIEISLEGKLLITLVSEIEETKGMLFGMIATKKDLKTFLIILSGPPTRQSDYVYKIEFHITHFSKVARREDGMPNFNISNGIGYEQKFAVKDDGYKAMLPLIDLFSTCNVSETLVKHNFFQLLD